MTAAATDSAMVVRPAGNGEVKPSVATPPVFMQGFDGMAVAPFPEAARKVLAEPPADEAVEIKPNGIVFVPGVWYRRQLTRAFGAGGWAIVPRQPARVMGDVVVYPGALYALGRFVAEATGECAYRQNSQMSYASCLEGAKTDALSRCCKDLGMATELWDKPWRDRWQAQYAETYTDRNGKEAWRIRSGRPVQDIDLMAGAGGVATAVPKASGQSPPAADAVASSSSPAFPASGHAPDAGEALGAEGVAAIRSQVKRLGWKAQFARIWLKERFGFDTPDALTADQGAHAHLLLSAFGTPLYDRILAELLQAGDVLA